MEGFDARASQPPLHGFPTRLSHALCSPTCSSLSLSLSLSIERNTSRPELAGNATTESVRFSPSRRTVRSRRVLCIPFVHPFVHPSVRSLVRSSRVPLRSSIVLRTLPRLCVVPGSVRWTFLLPGTR